MLVNGYPDGQRNVHVKDTGEGQESDGRRSPRLSIGSTYRHHTDECGFLEVGQHGVGERVCCILCEGSTPFTLLDRVLAEPGASREWGGGSKEQGRT